MLRHIVLFKFKADVPRSERENFIEELRRLPQQISEVLEWEVGEDITRIARSYDLALVSSYADQSALQRYTDHPNHLPVVAHSKVICESVVSVDYETDSKLS
jgi:hypothetical protein